MTGLPLISVLMPSYNYGRYIAEALDSVFAQSYKNIEVIVVDDGSTDDTRDIVARYKDVIYYYQENSGVATARNKLLELSKGEFIAWLDADDAFAEGAIEALYKTLEENPLCAYAQGLLQNYEIKPDGNIERFEPISYLQLSLALFRREVFDLYGTFDKCLNISEDVDLFLTLKFKKQQAAKSDHIITRRRLHAGSLSYFAGVREYCRRDQFVMEFIKKYHGKPHNLKLFTAPNITAYIYGAEGARELTAAGFAGQTFTNKIRFVYPETERISRFDEGYAVFIRSGEIWHSQSLEILLMLLVDAPSHKIAAGNGGGFCLGAMLIDSDLLAANIAAEDVSDYEKVCSIIRRLSETDGVCVWTDKTVLVKDNEEACI